MNYGDGNIGVGKLSQGLKSAVVHIALPQKRKYLALGFEKSLDDGLNMNSRGGTLTKCRDLNLAVTDWIRLVR